jgi:hypothetical protein
MALRTAIAPHSGPLDTPGELAYRYARSGVARSATTRSNYVAIQTAIDWIVRDSIGNISSVTDIRDLVLLDSLQITQAINDEPDTCSLVLRPQAAPAAIPQVGQEIRIGWAPGSTPLFHGYIVTSQSDWRALNQQPPWVALHCQDAMWRFDARMVTYRFPNQSVSASIAFLVQSFCNLSPTTPGPLDFSLAFVGADMPVIPAFDVVNQRPSTVMRTLTASVGGGFYIDGFMVHAWANSVSEPNQTNPTPLTVGLSTLHTFRLTQDATQVRRRVLVEGRRTTTLIGYPEISDTAGHFGIPVQDATQFTTAPVPPIGAYLTRIGTQWVYGGEPQSVTASGINPPQGYTAVAYTPGDPQLWMAPMTLAPPDTGWVRVGNQYTSYREIVPHPTIPGAIGLHIPTAANSSYAYLSLAIPVGELVEWVDHLMRVYPSGYAWDPRLRPQPTATPVVVLAIAEAPVDSWPPLEGFVQDGRYSYAGAQARANADLATFRDPLASAAWDTDDLNAIPGRSQVIALSSGTVNPPIMTTVTITQVAIRFPLPTLPPRRTCTGGSVKPSTFLDLVLTETN